MSKERADAFKARSHENSHQEDFRTPAYLWAWIQHRWNPTFDAACFADGSNALAKPLRLEDEWPKGSTVYSNPPFNATSYAKWLDKGRDHAAKGGTHVLLIPNRLCQLALVDRIGSHMIAEVWCLGGRVNFEGPFSCKGGTSRSGTIILIQRQSFWSSPMLFSERLSRLRSGVFD